MNKLRHDCYLGLFKRILIILLVIIMSKASRINYLTINRKKCFCTTAFTVAFRIGVICITKNGKPWSQAIAS